MVEASFAKMVTLCNQDDESHDTDVSTTVVYNRNSCPGISAINIPNNQSNTNCCLSLQAPASTSMHSTLDGHNPLARVRPNSVQSSSQELGVLQLGLKQVAMWGTDAVCGRSLDASFVSSLTT